MARRKASLGVLSAPQDQIYLWDLAQQAAQGAINAVSPDVYTFFKGYLTCTHDIARRLGPPDLAAAIKELIDQVMSSR